MVSHDLRAPIRVVEGFAKILKEDYGQRLDRVGNDHLERIGSAAQRMNHMIDALLALSKLSCQTLQNQPVDLSQLALYITEDLRRQSRERDVQVQIEPGLRVQGDPTLLRMLLENLLSNAWKYTSKKPSADIRLARHPEVPGAYTVSDNGAGFDMRFADRLFGAFQRLHSNNDFAGTGVGLASVQRIVRRHGGEVWAESAIDQGARFHFSLPGFGEWPS
jgi:light-regulated signal transduction histidine kinase (bacteriophytochrome)